MSSEIYKKVYEVVSQIPLGKVSTYGQISRIIGAGSPRIVGTALHKNPNPIIVPCHRVVNSEGKVAESFGFGGGKKQRELLESEGIRFIGDKVDMEEFLVDDVLFNGKVS